MSQFCASGNKFLALKVAPGPGVEFWRLRVKFIPLRVDFASGGQF